MNKSRKEETQASKLHKSSVAVEPQIEESAEDVEEDKVSQKSEDMRAYIKRVG